MAADLVAIENTLWPAADQLWANTGLKPADFSTPVLGLIFLRFADKRFTELTRKLRAQTDPPDISSVMVDVEDLLNDSIATEGYHIGPAGRPEALINLSEIDFEALQAKFAQSHKRTEAEKLRRLALLRGTVR